VLRRSAWGNVWRNDLGASESASVLDGLDGITTPLGLDLRQLVCLKSGLRLPASKTAVVLAVSMPDEVLKAWEWVIEPPHRVPGPGLVEQIPREFFVPARILNRYGPPEVVPEEAP
jgi:hypothetical protein